MAVPPVVDPLTNLSNESSAVSKINQNSQRAADAIAKALSTSDTTQNTMNVPLDMNSQRLLNLPKSVYPTDPVRLGEFSTLVAPLIPAPIKGEKGDPGSVGPFAIPRVNSVVRDVVARFNEGEVSLDDFVGANDTIKWQAAHDALGVAGGIINLPARDIVISGQITFTNPVWCRGKGWGESNGSIGTRVVLTSIAQTPFYITGIAAKAITFSDFSFTQTLHPTPSVATIQGTITSGQSDITGVVGASAVQINAPVSGPGIRPGSLVTAVNGTTVSISRAATASTNNATVTYYNPWTPANYPYVFDCYNIGGMVSLENIMATSCNKFVRSFNSGRLVLDHIYGHFFTNCVSIDAAFDCCRIENIHAWPYWDSTSLNVTQWTLANMDLMSIGRCDTPFIDNIFSIYGHHTITFFNGGYGPATRVHIGRVQADACFSGLNIPIDGVWLGFTKLDAQCEGFGGSTFGIAGSAGVIIGGSNNIVTFDTLNVQYTGGPSVLIAGSNNTLTSANTYVGFWDLKATGFPAFQVSNVASGPVNVVRLATLPVTNGGGGNNVIALTPAATNAVYDGFPPISVGVPLVSSTGTVTTANASFIYTRRGQVISYWLDGFVSANGNGSGSLKATLPFICGAAFSVANGRETALTGVSLAGTLPAGSNSLEIVTYSNAYPGGNGARLVINGSYLSS